MKETFVPKGFSDDACKMLAHITVILADYAAQGYDLSLRQLYYQLVSKNLVENTERSYKNVGTLVSDARLAGIIDWDMIKDRGREMVKNPHWGIYVIYLGDHDPSGIDMNRIALNMDQIERLRPPENPAKLTDSRATEYIKRFGKSSWELNAIEPRQLASMVTRAIESVMDVPKFEKNRKKMEKSRKDLLKFAKTYFGEKD